MSVEDAGCVGCEVGVDEFSLLLKAASCLVAVDVDVLLPLDA